MSAWTTHCKSARCPGRLPSTEGWPGCYKAVAGVRLNAVQAGEPTRPDSWKLAGFRSLACCMPGCEAHRVNSG